MVSLCWLQKCLDNNTDRLYNLMCIDNPRSNRRTPLFPKGLPAKAPAIRFPFFSPELTPFIATLGEIRPRIALKLYKISLLLKTVRL
jgi:hypothetical protein